ncbi:MAG: hypothetical protein AB1746_04210, partial [Candidatus Zixiibacteriota bacterium]
FKYGAGIVNGTGADPDNNNAKDLYVNLSQVIGRGDGQSAGQRAGAFAYLGWQPTDSPLYVGESGEADGKGNKSFYRLGGDASFTWQTFNLKLFMLYGLDDKAFNDIDTTQDYDYIGGFGRLDWAGLANNRVIVSAMYNFVKPPDFDEEKTINAFSGLVRYYLGDWTAVNVALHGEYTYRVIGKEEKDKQHYFAFLVDFDF